MKAKRNLIIFTVITLTSGWVGVWLDTLLRDQAGDDTLGMGLWLILPLLTALILRIVSRDWKDPGIKPRFKGNTKWYLSALAIYPAITVVTVGLAVIFNHIDRLSLNSFFTLSLTAAVSGAAKNIFEEFAWRGYLTPKLIDLKMNDWLLYLISGIIWALWHAPYYLVFLSDSYFESSPRISFVLSACILLPCWTIMYVEIYRLTKSVWPCVLMHAIEDAVPTLLTTGGFIVFLSGKDLWWNPVTGVTATILFVIFGLFLRRIRIKKEQDAS